LVLDLAEVMSVDLATIGIIVTALATLILSCATYQMASQMRQQMMYDRLVKEMENLVAPLYLKIYKDPITKITRGDSRFIRKRGSSQPPLQEFTTFWDQIKQYKYLGTDYFRNSLNEYFENISNEVFVERDPSYVQAETDLIKSIERRYSELDDEINRFYTKRWWQFWRRG
jgi:hypothetical protein